MGKETWLCIGVEIILICTRLQPTLMTLSYAFSQVSILPIYKEPSHRSEQVSQMLYGEKAEIQYLHDAVWAKIKTEWDEYVGFCLVAQLKIISKKEFNKHPKHRVADHQSKFILNESDINLPLGADLIKFQSNKEENPLKFKGKKILLNEFHADGALVCKSAFLYINSPYMWGGRSVFGIDCSGLSQMAYKLANVRMPRDASQQALLGETVNFLQNTKPGDLAFFDNTEGIITHVGVLLNESTIIHASEMSGKVVVDKIDLGGIISVALRKRTHNLRLIKRYI